MTSLILPAFGVTVRDFERLRSIACVLVDTTCGSVLKRLETRRGVRARRLHRIDPWQELPRRDEGHLEPGE